jgi:hypothetical protein
MEKQGGLSIYFTSFCLVFDFLFDTRGAWYVPEFV